MLSCLEHRRTTVLADGRWLVRPWDETSNSTHSRLFDKGFALARLLQEFDNANLASVSTSISTLSHCLHLALDMHTDLEKWYKEFLTSSPSPSYWPTPPSTFTIAQQQFADSGPRGLPLLCYPNLMVASNTVTLWALKLVLSSEIATICQIILLTNRKARADSTATDPAASLMLTSMAQRTEDQHGEEQRMTLAIDIARSLPYCLNRTTGLLGPRRAFFALRTAMATIRRSPGPEMEWGRAAIAKMETKSTLLERCSSIHTSLGLADIRDS